MPTRKLKPIISLVSYNKLFIRTVAVATKTSSGTNVKSWKDIPGPSSLPIIGAAHHFLPGGQLYNISNMEMSKNMLNTYGPIVRLEGIFGAPPIIWIAKPDLCEQVLRGENSMPVRPGFISLEYYRKSYMKNKGYRVKATGLITDHGETWKEFRSTVNHVMLQPKTIKLYSKVLDEVSRDMIARMRSIRDEDDMIKKNFDVEMNLWALESISTVALGIRLNCFDTNLAEDSPERQLIQCIHNLFATGQKLDFRPSLWRYFPTPLYKKAMKLYEKQENLTKYFIKRGVEELKKNNNTTNEKGVLEKLIEIDEEVAMIMASDMLFAGVDTAANTMSSILYLLATNPAKQEKLRTEILTNQEKSPYIRACIKESMRIMPIVSGNLRKITKDYLLEGYHIPKDMMVVFAHRDMSLMDDHYPNAKEFIPERWLSDKSDPLHYKNAHPFANAPFGFGVRSCIGRRIAELEIETFLSQIMRNFRVEWTGSQPNLVQTSLIYFKEPFDFVFKDI